MMTTNFNATILRDTFGIPHVFAETEVEALYGFGYAQAQDRLPTLLAHYLAARGGASAILGASALEKDIAARAFRIRELAEKTYSDLSAEVHAGVEAFAEGINRYQKDTPEHVPAWAFPVTALDIAALGMMFNLYFADDHFERTPTERGSNGFAVAGSRTASGKSIVSLDPHLPFDGPLRWYEGHVCGGEMNVYGVTFAGIPYIVMGCNGKVAWANTVNDPDLSDLYEIRLQLEPGKLPTYEYDGVPRPVDARQYDFVVRQGDSARTITKTILSTHHGPILREAGGKRYAIRKAGVGDIHVLTQVREQCLAKNIDEYRAALAGCHVVMFNHMFGDAAGRIGYISAGKVPHRPDGYDFHAAVSGWTSATEWGNYLPIEKLPQSIDPPNGWVQNCNDAPGYCGASSMQVPPPYPSWLAPDVRTLRGARLAELLSEIGVDVTLEQARTIAVDIKDLNAARELQALLHVAKQEPSLAEAVQLLSEWDGELHTESRGAALFQAWLMQPDIAGCLPIGGWVSPDYQTLPRIAEADPHRATAALSAALEWLELYGFARNTTWGQIHRLRRGNVDLPMDGGLDSLSPNGGPLDDTTGTVTAAFGASYRCLAEPDGDATQLWACLPWGNSDDPTSLHYTDQLPLAARREYRKVPWTRAAIEAEAITVMEL